MATIYDATLKQTTTYGYDLVGNRTRETTEREVGKDTQLILQSQTNEYDCQNRLKTVATGLLGPSGQLPAFYVIKYEYDGNGNRLVETTDYNTPDRTDRATTVTNHFDTMNRLIKSTSLREWTPVARGNQVNKDGVTYEYEDPRIPSITVSHELTYDKMGNRTSDIETHGETETLNETYKYDSLGRLAEIWNKNGIQTGYRYYDQYSHVVVSRDGADYRASSYDAAGRLEHQSVWQNSVSGVPATRIDYTNYDGLGNLVQYVVTEGTKVTTYTSEYKASFDSWVEVRQVLNDGAETAKEYAYGRLVLVTMKNNKNETSTIKLMNDANGQILQQDKGGRITHMVLANGQLLGGSDETSELFTQRVSSITSGSSAASPSVYTVPALQSMQDVANAVWGDRTLWWLIANANPGVDTGQVPVNTKLNIPVRVSAVHADYQTFEAYDPAKIIGDTTPRVAALQGQGGGCGNVGKLIMVAVSVAVTMSTGVPTSVLQGALMGAAGSMAGQAVGVVLGVQDSIDWKGVALSAVSNGISTGVGVLASAENSVLPTIFNASSPAGAVARAALSNAAYQAVTIVSSQQNGFSWKNVAASAAGAYVGASTQSDVSKVITNPTLAAGASGFAAGMTTAVMRGGKINVTQVATDAFGNALGNELGGSLAGIGSEYGQGSTGAPLSKAQAERASYGGMSRKQVLNGEKDYLGMLSAFSGDFALNQVGSSWNESVAAWQAANPRYVQQVQVQDQRWSAEQKVADMFPGSDSFPLNATEQSRNFNQRFYNAQEASASNPVSAAFWHVAGVTSDAAHNLEAAGRGVASLITDGQARAAALNGLQQTWDHLPSVVIKGMQNFSQMSYGQQAGSLYKFGLESVATFGAGKVVGAAGSLAYDGSVSTLKWLAPKAGEFAFDYAQ
ncbi:hypothetical protein ACLB1G_02330 [Oxalobacteraceae bacterium A2-2]